MSKNVVVAMMFGVCYVAMPLKAATEYANGYTWTYYISGNMAVIENFECQSDDEDSWFVYHPAVSPAPTGSVVIPSTLGGKPVKRIGSYALKNCSGLTSVTIPSSVEYIGYRAFDECCRLRNIYITDLAAWCGISFDNYDDDDDYDSCGLANPLSCAYYYNSSDSSPAKLYLNGSLVTKLMIPDGVTNIADNAFCNCANITSVTIPNSVQRIGERAFSGCSSLTNMVLPFVGKCRGNSGSIASLFGYIFGNRSYIGSFPVTQYISSGFIEYDGDYFHDSSFTFRIPSSLRHVTITDETIFGYSAFCNCTNLTSVTIPNGVTNIEYRAFYNCGGLTSVTIPDSVTSIGSEAFYNCRGLTSVTIPDSVTSIGHNAFYNTSFYNNQPDGLVVFGKVAYKMKGTRPSTVTIPQSVMSISPFAFSGCSGLTSVIIPNSVTRILEMAFYNCDGLTSVTIPDSVTSIGYRAFSGCSGLTSVTIGNGVTSIVSDTFESCHRLRNVIVPQYVCSRGLSSVFYSAYQSITNIVISDGVTNIEYRAFYNCGGLTSVTIPDSVTSIGSEAFYNCRGLTSVTIPDSVTSIGSSAFNGCSGLRDVTVPQSVCNNRMSSVFPSAYQSITNVVISGSVTNIANSAFSYCNSLTSVTIPNSVTSIGSSAFSGCSGLTSVTIPNSVTSIGNDAFVGCNGLTGVYISDLASWCRIAFDSGTANPLYCAHSLYLNGALISDLTIPNNVASIGAYAFYNCSTLTSVTIPDSVTSIGNQAFNGCSGLKDVTAPSRWAFSTLFPAAYSNIGSVVVPSGSSGIVSGAFRGCTSLTDITIPDTVTSIGDEAFYNCTSLETLSIPAGVTSYGVNCFEGCPAYTLQLYRSIFGGETAGAGSSTTTIVQQVESPYALTDHAADRAIASVTVDNDCAIDSFVLKDGKVYDSMLYISNTASRTVTLTLPSGYVYKAIKGARPLSIPANSQSILSITRVANNVFLVSREDLETIQ